MFNFSISSLLFFSCPLGANRSCRCRLIHCSTNLSRNKIVFCAQCASKHLQRLGRSHALIGTRVCFSLKRKNLRYTAGGDGKHTGTGDMSIEDAKKAAGLITHTYIFTHTLVYTRMYIQEIYKKIMICGCKCLCVHDAAPCAPCALRRLQCLPVLSCASFLYILTLCVCLYLFVCAHEI